MSALFSATQLLAAQLRAAPLASTQLPTIRAVQHRRRTPLSTIQLARLASGLLLTVTLGAAGAARAAPPEKATATKTPDAASTPDQAPVAQPLTVPEAVPLSSPTETASPGGGGLVGEAGDDAEPGTLDEPRPRGVTLTPAERALLLRGPISGGAYVGGGLLGTWLGFGLGHAVQGRYDEGGLLFSAGQATGFIMLIAGAVSLSTAPHCEATLASEGLPNNATRCVSNPSSERLWTGVAIGGGVLYAVLRIWEIADLWTTPPRHNAAYRRVLAKTRPGWSSLSIRPVPLPGGGMAVAGVKF